MSLRVTLEVDALDLADVQAALQDRAGLNARIAGDAEIFVKARGRETSQSEHRSASRLGATPTGHLADAYEAIESTSDESSARLLVPRASRLRAAFGGYVLTPGSGRKYLTIPVNREAYGKRAGEMEDLFFMRVGTKGTPVLARRVEGEKDQGLRTRTNQRRQSRRFTQAEVMYVLVTNATIPEDTGLIPFEDLAVKALSSAEAFLDETLSDALT